MGVGAAGIMPSTLSILTNVFTEEERRARAIGIWSGTTGLGIAVGPIVGGWLLAHYWWGSVFLINVPIAAVGLLATAWLVPDSRNADARLPDPVGALASTVGLALLLWGIIEAPNRSWSSPLVIAAMCGGMAVLAGFVIWERASDHPMLQLQLFGSRRFSTAIVSMSLVILALMGALFMLTQYLQFSLGYSALQTGLRIGPIAAVILVVAPCSSLLVRRLGTKLVVGAGMAVVVAGMLMVARTSVQGTYMGDFPGFMLIGFGMGLAFAPATESVMGSLPLGEAGVGSATNSAGIQVGGALGVGLLGSLLNTRYQDQLVPLLAHQPMPAAVHHLIVGSLGGALGVAGTVGGRLGSELAGAAREAFVSGLDLALVVGALVVGAGALLALALLPSRSDRSRSGGRNGTNGSSRTSLDLVALDREVDP